jgi:hypothetical protein
MARVPIAAFPVTTAPLVCKQATRVFLFAQQLFGGSLGWVYALFPYALHLEVGDCTVTASSVLPNVPAAVAVPRELI